MVNLEEAIDLDSPKAMCNIEATQCGGYGMTGADSRGWDIV